MELNFYKISILLSTYFAKKCNLKDITMNKTVLKKIINYFLFPKDSETINSKRFVNIDDGHWGGSSLTCFYMKSSNSYFFDSFIGSLDRFLLQQLTKPSIFHNHKYQDIYSNLCGVYCLYFFFLIERIDYRSTSLKASPN